MARSPKTTRSKKVPAKRKAASRKTAGPRKPAAKASGRRPSSKRAPAKKKTARRRSKVQGRGFLARVGAGLAGFALLVLAALTLSWPGDEESQKLAAADSPAKDESKEAPVPPASKPLEVQTTKVKKAVSPKTKPETVAAPAEKKAPPKEVAVVPPKASASPAWKRYAAAHSAKAGQPMIAIVLDDLGPSKQRSGNAIELPGPLTLAFLPYADDLPAMTARARKRGHELLIHMPMEPKDLAGNNPGKNALLTSLSDAEIGQRLDWAMQRFPAFVGINNHMGSAFTADRRKMDLVMQRLARSGALFLDSVTSGASQGESAAKAAGIPTIARDIFLDHGGDDPGMVLQQLAKAEALAKRQGYAIAIGHPHDGTVTALEIWIPDAIARGFVLVPISALVSAPEGSGLRG